MPTTGSELVAAITNNITLMAIDNCPGVPVQIGRAVYGAFQNDNGGIDIKNDYSKVRNINEAIYFSGGNTQTAVWHFSTTGTVHHFIVIPWYRKDSYPYGRVYTVLMAYEGKYKLEAYVKGVDPAVPGSEYGYKAYWTPKQLTEMLVDLLDGEIANTAWKRYFDPTALRGAAATGITCYKYKNISFEKAIENLKKLSGVA